MEQIREWVVLGILCWNCYTDIRRKKISLFSVCLLAAAGIIFQMADGMKITAWALSLIPGIVMIGLSAAVRGALGLGDGLLTIGLGCCLGLAGTVQIVLTGLFLSAAAAGIDFLFIRKKGTAELPFVPFLLLGNIGRLLLWGN